jgi:hypothetical protein
LGIIKIITVLLLLCLAPPCKAQEDSAIPWNAHRKLSWADFRGKPLKTAWAAATTASGISYEYTAQEKGEGYEVDFKIGAFFYPDKSWYQQELCDELVLGHEQLHFDISELYARKMSKIMAETRFTKNARAEVKAIYKSILKELGAFQLKYDHETNYSRDKEKQLHWNKKINMALNGKN